MERIWGVGEECKAVWRSTVKCIPGLGNWGHLVRYRPKVTWEARLAVGRHEPRSPAFLIQDGYTLDPPSQEQTAAFHRVPDAASLPRKDKKWKLRQNFKDIKEPEWIMASLELAVLAGPDGVTQDEEEGAERLVGMGVAGDRGWFWMSFLLPLVCRVSKLGFFVLRLTNTGCSLKGHPAVQAEFVTLSSWEYLGTKENLLGEEKKKNPNSIAKPKYGEKIN